MHNLGRTVVLIDTRARVYIIVVLTYSPSVLMCVEIADAPKL